MLKSYKGGSQTFYDIKGYGKEGSIQGLTIKDLRELSEEIEETILNDINIDIKESMDKFDKLIEKLRVGL